MKTSDSPQQPRDEKGKFAEVAAAPADKPKDKPEEQGKEKVDTSAIQLFGQRMLTGDDAPLEKKKADIPKKPDAAEKPTPEKPKAAAEKPKATPAKKTVVPEEKPLTRAEIARAAAEGTATALAGRNTQPRDKVEEEKPADPLASLSPRDKRKALVLQQMEKDFSDDPRYKDLANRWISGRQELKKYSDDWSAKHPGEEFDYDAEEHQAFLDRHDVTWEDEDYIESAAQLKATSIATAAIEAERKQLNEKLAPLELKEKLREATGIINREQTSAARKFWKTLGDDFAGIIKEDGSVDNERLKELHTENPEYTGIRVQAAENVDALVSTAYKLLNGLQKFDDKNTEHVYLNDFALGAEDRMLKLPVEEQLDDKGRQFKTRDEWNKLSEEARKSFWTFSATDISVLIAQDEAKKAADRIDFEERKFRRIAQSRGMKFEEPPKKTGTELEDRERQESDADDGKPRSPSAAPEPKVAASTRTGKETAQTGVTAFANTLLGKS